MCTVTERPVASDPPLYAHPGWEERFPWLIHGITGRGEGDPYDLALFGEQGNGSRVFQRWFALSRRLGAGVIVHGQQVHGSRVGMHRGGGQGLRIVPSCDGHVTAEPGTVLSVSVADCVPVYVLDPGIPAVALLHAGWRGVSEGIVERGIEALVDRLGSDPSDLHLHLGPAICEACYEVGPEVHRALGLEEPPAPTPLDLRSVVARRAQEKGVASDRVERSSLCTRCGPPTFFSHRGGDPERQVAFIGIGVGGG